MSHHAILGYRALDYESIGLMAGNGHMLDVDRVTQIGTMDLGTANEPLPPGANRVLPLKIDCCGGSFAAQRAI
jgi:hypothetical protein